MSIVLVGDIGGTHARLGLVDLETGRFEAPPVTLLCGDHAGLEDLLAAYLRANPDAGRATEVAVAVAGPVTNGAASFTNLSWSVSDAGLEAAGFARAAVINDFEALALAARRVTAADKAPIGPALAPRRGTIAVLGPGTGLGAAAWCVDARGSAALVTEGGHMGFSPSDEVELEVWRILARRFGRVSLERILSGSGLVNLHAALNEIEGSAVAYTSPAELLDAARRGEPTAQATLERFCSILGSAAADFALAYGAVGGVLLAGGLPPRMLDELNAGGFRAAFERKGRLSGYLETIPTEVIIHPYLALVGAAERLRWLP